MSEPPCFSVIAIPIVTPDLPGIGREDGSYRDATILGVHLAAMSGWHLNAAGAAAVMVIGQHTPGSACAIRNSRPACSTWPAAAPLHTADETPASTPSVMSR